VLKIIGAGIADLPFLLPLNLFLPCDRFAGLTPLQFLARQRYQQ